MEHTVKFFKPFVIFFSNLRLGKVFENMISISGEPIVKTGSNFAHL
jgi:hypothetical protein